MESRRKGKENMNVMKLEIIRERGDRKRRKIRVKESRQKAEIIKLCFMRV